MSSASLEYAMLTLSENARRASRFMMRADCATQNRALLAMAQTLVSQRAQLQGANEKDLDAARRNGLEPALLERLTLSDKALDLMAEGLHQIAGMLEPIGSISATSIRPNGMRIAKMRVPLGASVSFMSRAPTSPSTRPPCA